MADTFDSSDARRSMKPLKHAQSVTFDQPMTLEKGGQLPQVTVVYETYGQLNAARDNAVFICHSLSGDSHVAQHDDDDDPGWWDLVVGPGKAIDTNRYFIICPNILGGCRGTTGPISTNPATGKPYGPDFPIITIGDMVDVHKKLVDHLGIPKLHAVVGGSLGGHQTLCWATRYPDRVAATLPIATSPRLTIQALAFDIVGRNAILSDPAFHDGRYTENNERPTVGLAIARMLGHITYLSQEAMARKFDSDRLQPRDIATAFEKKFSVGSYLAYQGDQFVERFDANSYVAISMAMDIFDLANVQDRQSAPLDWPEYRRALTHVLSQTTCRWLVLSFTSDWLFPPYQSAEIVDALIAADRPVSYVNVRSTCGHDAFLLQDDLPVFGSMIRNFLERTAIDSTAITADLSPSDEANSVRLPNGEHEEAHSPVSIFHGHRLDYDMIVKLIPPDASVLDLGCGGGALATRLLQRGQKRVMGVELGTAAIGQCIARGIDVIRADLNRGLPTFAAHQFDVVVLSQTLQSIDNVRGIIDEILRIGRRCIVSFPNFAYKKLRSMLADEGRAPEAAGILSYHWYDTPNKRFFSIRDFEEYCRANHIQVHHEVCLDIEADTQITDDPNLNADMAIFVISRPPDAAPGATPTD